MRLVCDTSMFLTVTKVNYEIGFLYLCGPEKGIILTLEKSQNWLHAQDCLAPEFSLAECGY